MKYSIYLLLFVFGLNSCKPKQKNTENATPKVTTTKNTISYRLDDEKWILRFVESKEVSFADDGMVPDLVFNTRENKISGYASCNRFGGSFSGNDGKITISKIFATRRACMEKGRNEVEMHYLQLIEQATRYEIADNKKLTLFHEDKVILVFER